MHDSRGIRTEDLVRGKLCCSGGLSLIHEMIRADSLGLEPRSAGFFDSVSEAR